MSTRVLLLVLALGVTLAACGGTETGNPGGAQVALGVRASDPAKVDVGAGGGGDHVDALLLAIDQAALVGCGTDPAATPLFEQGPVVDLVRGAPGERAVPAGDYCGLRVTLRLGDLPAVGEAPAIDGATVAAYGVRDDGVPFTIVSRAPRAIVVEGEPFRVRDGDDLVLAFDVSVWLGDGVLAAAPLVDGRATIDGNGDSAAQFDHQIAAGLHRDFNDDGTVDADEAVPLVTLEPSGVRPFRTNNDATRTSGGSDEIQAKWSTRSEPDRARRHAHRVR